MLATPLLTVLSQAFPHTRFDWAVSEWARPAISSNPRLTEIVQTSQAGLHELSWRELYALAQSLREENYDTCLIPSRSGLLSLVAWWARIPQRIGLHEKGRGFAHTTAIKPKGMQQHEAAVYLTLAAALGVPAEKISTAAMEFYPPDIDRTAVTRRLVSENWLGDSPLVLMHPGGGANPVRANKNKQWPVERFVRLANYVIGKYKAQVILVGAKADIALAKDVSGLLSWSVVNLAGQLNLGQLGALCEVANLYIGNDSGPTHVAAAVGCPTLAIFGPTDPAISGPYATKGRVKVLGQGERLRPFSWENWVPVQEARKAVDQLLT